MLLMLKSPYNFNICLIFGMCSQFSIEWIYAEYPSVGKNDYCNVYHKSVCFTIDQAHGNCSTNETCFYF